MTPFELWQAGEGPEPTVRTPLPSGFKAVPVWELPLADGDAAWSHDLRDRDAASEECRAALARAVADLLPLPTARIRERYLVVIHRETETSAYGFAVPEAALSFFETAGTQWSDTYLTRILMGPRDLCGEPDPDPEAPCAS